MSAAAPALTAPMWVKFKGNARYHAVYATAPGGYWLFCSRFYRTSAVTEASPADALPSWFPRCSCCCSRMRLPYMIPPELRKIREEAGP
jgi:hypothetical protein